MIYNSYGQSFKASFFNTVGAFALIMCTLQAFLSTNFLPVDVKVFFFSTIVGENLQSFSNKYYLFFGTFSVCIFW